MYERCGCSAAAGVGVGVAAVRFHLRRTELWSVWFGWAQFPHTVGVGVSAACMCSPALLIRRAGWLLCLLARLFVRWLVVAGSPSPLIGVMPPTWWLRLCPSRCCVLFVVGHPPWNSSHARAHRQRKPLCGVLCVCFAAVRL